MSTASVSQISPADFMQLRQQGKAVDLFDVRNPDEYQAVHAQGAKLLPLDMISAPAVIAQRQGSGGEPIYLICKSGKRATDGVQRLTGQGMENVVCVTGGTDAWVAAGLPVVRGKATISIMRQVQMIAGGVVLLGVVLGYTVHPGLFALSGAVGAGLFFAGATGTCGLAMALKAMPWNSCSGGSCGSRSCSV